MARYFARRILSSLLLLVSVSILSFVLLEFAPGDFYETLRLNPRVSEATVNALRSQHGVNSSLPVRYFRWVHSVSKGEWGYSLAYDSPAAPILWTRAKNTLLLTGTAMILAWIIAIPFGTWGAARRGKAPDWFVRGTTSILLAIPDLVLALLLVLCAVRSGYFPAGGMVSFDFSEMSLWAKFRDLFRHLFLPCLCLAASSFPVLLSHTRTAVLEVLESPFITAARGYGIPVRRLLFRHALPAAANPLISLFGVSIGVLLSSSVLIEVIFGWPGLGQLLLEAILQRDFFLVIDSAMLATAFLVSGNLIADVLLYACDPRVRAN
ncbi:MAG: ABC transporter permease [Acidobacteriaceae bacterium]|nr:ABC transporter permease [Acidobacteriaceae bacterium]MBV9779401.1 ABC transporter permease [Acidobacteriaceae bacterium]